MARERPLPPRVPDEVAEIESVMALLGAYIQVGGKLRKSKLEQLKEALGALPGIEDAKRWKSGLKELRADLAELERRG